MVTNVEERSSSREQSGGDQVACGSGKPASDPTELQAAEGAHSAAAHVPTAAGDSPGIGSSLPTDAAVSHECLRTTSGSSHSAQGDSKSAAAALQNAAGHTQKKIGLKQMTLRNMSTRRSERVASRAVKRVSGSLLELRISQMSEGPQQKIRKISRRKTPKTGRAGTSRHATKSFSSKKLLMPAAGKGLDGSSRVAKTARKAQTTTSKKLMTFPTLRTLKAETARKLKQRQQLEKKRKTSAPKRIIQACAN